MTDPDGKAMTERANSQLPKTCPHCGGAELYCRRSPSSTNYSPWPLNGLGSFLHVAAFEVVVCEHCGLTQFFAEPSARRKLKSSSLWERVS